MSQPPAIDVHQHVVPPDYARWLAAQRWHLPVPEWTADRALAAMDGQQIETALLSVTTPGLYLAGEADARRLARQVNEFAAEQVGRRPGRFGFFATLTLPDVDGAIAEAAYALDELSADGVMLLANAGGRYLGDPLFHPLYAELDRRGAVLLLHPTFPAALGPPAATGNPRSDVDLLAETTRSAVDLVSSGVLTRFGRLRVILAHAGGYLPYMSHRIAPMCAPDSASPRGDDPPSTPRRGASSANAYQAGLDLLGQFYFDVALSSSAVTLAALMAFARPGHVLFGTDWPYAPPVVIDHFHAELSAYPFADGERDSVLRTAAEHLFPRLRRPLSRKAGL